MKLAILNLQEIFHEFSIIIGFGSVVEVFKEIPRSKMKFIGKKAGMPMTLYETDGVETLQTTDGSKEAVFVMNHNAYKVFIPLEKEYTEMITEQKLSGILSLMPYDVAILG